VIAGLLQLKQKSMALLIMLLNQQVKYPEVEAHLDEE
jgi:hypothetical protein